jgi:DNA-directed RNA polymerase subunit F
MFTFDEYTKNFEKFSTQNPFMSSHSLDSIFEFNSKLSKIALDTLKKSAELSQDWSKETLNSLDTFTKTHKNPSDYSKVINDFITQQTQSSPKHIAEFAEIAKKAQLDTIDLYMSAGKEMNEEMTKTAKKTTNKTVVTSSE